MSLTTPLSRPAEASDPEMSPATAGRASELMAAHQNQIYAQTSHLFTILMTAQWLAGIVAALWISPRAWSGSASHIHVHVWLAIFLGGAITSLPVFLTIFRPEDVFTRHTVAVCQMLMSALLIHLSGGRIETHFHVFGSLAFLAFYRDWRVLIPATMVVAADHALRGIYFPQSVFGILTVSPWRWVEHAGWVAFEDVILVKMCLQSVREMWEIARRQASIEAISRAKSEFLANMSHEIRTPMNGVLGMTELALDTELSPAQREYLSLARDSAHALLAVINDVLDFSKIEAGMLNLNPVEFHPRDNVHEIVRALALSAHQKGLELVYDVDPGVPEVVLGDALRIRQVLVNLIGNAIKFTPKGELTVSVGVQPQEPPGAAAKPEIDLRFEIRDTGIGISPAKHLMIFRAFTQADNSMTRQYGGTGLGLTISKRLVEMMAGRIWLSSEPGKGSTFCFSVPVGLVEGPPKTAEISRARLRGVPVLVVDDNATSRRVLAEWLTQWGMWPILADSAKAAIKLLDSTVQGIPLVLTDGHMPETDGFELLKHIQRTTRTPTVVLLTSASYAEDVERSRQLGAEACLIKPVRQDSLLETILRVLAKRPPAEASLSNWHRSIQRLDQELRAGSVEALHILVVEDNLINQRYAVSLLEGQGHRVTVAGNGQEAVTALERETFHVVLMDIQMPVMDGFEATSAIRAREKFLGRRTPIIAMTAHAMSGDRDKCLAAGMDAYVTKPIGRAELLDTILSLAAGQRFGIPSRSTDRGQVHAR